MTIHPATAYRHIVLSIYVERDTGSHTTHLLCLGYDWTDKSLPHPNTHESNAVIQCYPIHEDGLVALESNNRISGKLAAQPRHI